MASAADNKTVADSEKAFAEAASGAVSEKAVKKAVNADEPKPEVKPAKVAKAVAAKPKKASKPVAKKAKPAPKKVAKKPAAKATKAAPKKAEPKTKKAAETADVTIPSLKKKAATKSKTTKIAKAKETIMAKSKKTESTIIDSVKSTMEDVQGRAKTAFAKTGEVAGDVVEFNKANVEAMVESGKVLAAGVQDMGKVYVEEAKGAYETMTGDMKDYAAIKSPTELFQLQGKIARRNFDDAVAFSSKNTEMLVKLANDAFAPISNRVSVAAEKISKAA